MPNPIASSVLVLALAVAAPVAPAAKPGPVKFDFEADEAGKEPKGFELGRTGRGRPGAWLVRAEDGAPSGKKVLVQTDTDDTDYRFPFAVAGPALKDLRLSVRCRAISGAVDQGFGLVWRLQDADNYYVARANALEDNVRVYKVVGGDRRQLGWWSGKVVSGVWHELVVEASGDHFVVEFDGKKILDEHDQTFAAAGKFGVWTKADSVIAFVSASILAVSKKALGASVLAASGPAARSASARTSTQSPRASRWCDAMGVNTWAAFAGSDDLAMIDGDFAMLKGELQGVLAVLRGAGINIVAIHQHLTHEEPRMMFLHYWGFGPTVKLAAAVKAAVATQRR